MADYLIAIGGTGARVTESVVHLCECGFFRSPKTKILIIDADDNCGNKLTAEKLIESYNKCRNLYYDNGKDIFKTDITPVFNPGGTYNNESNKTYSVSPVSDEKGKFTIETNLVKSGKENREAVNLMKALYSWEDYTKDIRGGFYAHPSIGALMFERWIEEGFTQVNDMLQSMKNDAAKEDINVFIIASSFGGTGASGFPAIARLIRESPFTKPYNNKIHIAGCFILPYFDVINKKAGDKIDFTSFNESAKNTLMHYERYDSARVYDTIYLLANDENIIRGTYAEEGTNQENWPHMVELVAALAADEYFASPNKGIYNESTDPDWLGFDTNSNNIRNLQWSDLPRGTDLKKAISKFVMFNLMYVPCVLNEFLKVQHTERDIVRFDTKPLKSVTWDAIMGKDFITMDFSHMLPKKEFGQNFDCDDFAELFKFFNFHIKWLYRLINEYGTKRRYVTGLFGDNEDGISAFERRYSLAMKQGSQAEFTAAFEDETFAKHVNSYKHALGNHEITEAQEIYTNIFQMKKQRGQIGVNNAVKSIIQEVYEKSTGCVK